jgi:hypothetical protein
MLDNQAIAIPETSDAIHASGHRFPDRRVPAARPAGALSASVPGDSNATVIR